MTWTRRQHKHAAATRWVKTIEQRSTASHQDALRMGWEAALRWRNVPEDQWVDPPLYDMLRD